MSTRALALVMPMAGRGSRFQTGGPSTPKPLIELWGRPFFWWAVESVRRAAPVGELVFVVLAEHVAAFAIDARIRALYPEARIVTAPDVTAGAAATAALGVAALESRGPLAINDCDHAFAADGLGAVIDRLGGRTEGALVGFRADSPAYSYVRLDRGTVMGTVEKQVVSEFAIAGCYLFASAATFVARFAEYRSACTHGELYLSGVYNAIVGAGAHVLFRELTSHVPFGTPEELARVRAEQLAFIGSAER